jgi:hypothetical protein
MAAELRQQGLHVTDPSADEPCTGQPDIEYIAVLDPATGHYAEVSLVKHAPDPGDWFLQLSYWTERARDPDGRHMASRVRRVLSGCPERNPEYRATPVPGPPAPPSAINEPESWS